MKTKESRVALQYNSRILPELWLSLLKLMKRAPKNLPRASLSSSSTAENRNFMALMEILNPSSFLLTCTATSLHTDSFRWPPPSDSIATKNSEEKATEDSRNPADTTDERDSEETGGDRERNSEERNQEGTRCREVREDAEETKKEGETNERRRGRFRSTNFKTSLGALMATSTDSYARPKTDDQYSTKDGHKSSISATEVSHHSQRNTNSSASSSSSISASSSSSSLLQSSNSEENGNGAEYTTASSNHFMASISESEEISSRDIFFDCTVDEKTEDDDESMAYLNVSPQKIKPAEKAALCSISDHNLRNHYLLSSASSNLSRSQSSTEKSMISKHVNLHSHPSASSARPNLSRMQYTDSSINIHSHLSSSPSSPYTRNNHSRLSSSPSTAHHKHRHLSSFPSPSSYNSHSLLSSPQSSSTHYRHRHLSPSPSPPQAASKTANIDRAPLTSRSTLHQSEAMAKYSHDPCSDFVSSITEMIIAHDLTQREEDLEDLFQCYLHLNPPKHHPTIALAFLSAMADLHVHSSSPRE